MGCCVSTNKDSKFNKVGSESLKSKPTHESRAPPPSHDQEESVKEVLSETPRLKQPPPPAEPIKNPTKKHQQHHHEDDNYNNNTAKTTPFQPTTPPLLDEKMKMQGSRYKNEKMFHAEEILEQEVSEVCSMSLSEKLSTKTINNGSMECEDRDKEEVKQRVVKSPAPRLASRNRVPGDLGAKRDRPPPLVGRPPSRLTDQSRSGINNAARSVQSREHTSRRGLRSHPNRTDSGESSERLTATNRSTMGGRSQPAEKANQSPGGVRTDPHERGGNVTNMGDGSSAANSTTASSGTGNESLKTPLVSLECFIFL